MPTISDALAQFVDRLRLADVPREIRDRAKHLILDALGCALAARGEAFASRLAAACAALSGDLPSDGARGVIGFARHLTLRDAAMLNGMLAHGLDYDDTHMAGIIHLSVSVMPTVLGVCAQRNDSGATMLAAYIAGLEAGARIAQAAQGGLHAQGFHPTGVVGAFASTLAAGRVLGLSAAQLARAQGTVLSMAGGSLQFLEDGAWTKRLHPGWAAQCAIVAATLSAHDVPAPLAAYEGRFGLFNLYLGDVNRAKVDLSRVTAGITDAGSCSTWEIPNIAVKPFAVCHFSHACADAAIALHRSGLDIASIRSIRALVPAATMPVVCEPIAAKRRPQSDYDAKFSLPYAIASGLLRGRLGLQDLMPAAFNEPAALALMDRVSCEADSASTFPRHYGGALRVTLADGRVIEHHEPVNRGHAERPLVNADVRDKFFENATLHFPRAHAQAICDAVLAMETLGGVRTLESLLAQDPSPVR